MILNLTGGIRARPRKKNRNNLSISFGGKQEGRHSRQMGHVMEKHRGGRTSHVRRTINAEYC